MASFLVTVWFSGGNEEVQSCRDLGRECVFERGLDLQVLQMC